MLMEKAESNRKTVAFRGVLVILVAALITILAFRLGVLGNTVSLPAGSIPLSDAPMLVSAGDKIAVTVLARSFEDMYGYQVKINYDREDYSYAGGLTSSVDGISTIFSKAYDGYALISATMVGQQEGAYGADQPVCRMTLEVLRDGVVSPKTLSVSEVSVMASDLSYKKNVPGWSYVAAPAN